MNLHTIDNKGYLQCYLHAMLAQVKTLAIMIVPFEYEICPVHLCPPIPSFVSNYVRLLTTNQWKLHFYDKPLLITIAEITNAIIVKT